MKKITAPSAHIVMHGGYMVTDEGVRYIAPAPPWVTHFLRKGIAVTVGAWGTRPATPDEARAALSEQLFGITGDQLSPVPAGLLSGNGA